MKLCCCVGTNIERIELTAKVGYKYCELGFSSIESMTDEAYTKLKEKLADAGLTPIAANSMFPAKIGLLRGKEGYSEIREYLMRAFPKAKEIGIPVVVLGSGPSRNVPEGMTKEEAVDRFCALLADVIGPLAAEYGIIVALEELRIQECNFINTCKEAMEIIRRVNHPNIKLLLDFYHAILGGDTLEELEAYGAEYIVHVHYGSPINERQAPKFGIDEHLVKEYFAMLKKIGYNGGFSLEGNMDDYEADAAEALDVMSAEL